MAISGASRSRLAGQFALPCLMLNYMGRRDGAFARCGGDDLIRIRSSYDPTWSLPVVFLALAATIIASQAVISGAFSLTQQAIQLGFMPRMQIKHTSAHTAGQIYIPAVNCALMVMVLVLVLFFRSSSNLAAAYGIAVTGAMFIDTILLAVVLFSLWRWPAWKALPLVAVFIVVDMAYSSRQPDQGAGGGWVPLGWAGNRSLLTTGRAAAS
jgi:KUP system potassium uptake protein